MRKLPALGEHITNKSAGRAAPRATPARRGSQPGEMLRCRAERGTAVRPGDGASGSDSSSHSKPTRRKQLSRPPVLNHILPPCLSWPPLLPPLHTLTLQIAAPRPCSSLRIQHTGTTAAQRPPTPASPAPPATQLQKTTPPPAPLTSWPAARLSPRQRPLPAQRQWQTPGCTQCHACYRCCRRRGRGRRGGKDEVRRPAP